MNEPRPDPKYSNDDHSRFASKDYKEHPDLDTFDEANYYEDRQFSIGGVDIEAEDDVGNNQFGAKAGFDHSTGGEKVPMHVGEDTSIGEKGSELLRKNAAVDASHILLSVHDSDITLRGEVPDEAQRYKAEHCLKKIPGLGKIINELEIRNAL